MTTAFAELLSDDDSVDIAAASTAATSSPTTPVGSLRDDEQAEHLVVPLALGLREQTRPAEQQEQPDADQQEQQELHEDHDPAEHQREPGLAERLAQR